MTTPNNTNDLCTNAEYIVKDSGQRETFPTGAIRDSRSGKGRYDLLSPHALRRDAMVYEGGANKYPPRNWELGMPCSRCMDSALRHLMRCLEGDADEDHLAMARFNIGAILHYEEEYLRREQLFRRKNASSDPLERAEASVELERALSYYSLLDLPGQRDRVCRILSKRLIDAETPPNTRSGEANAASAAEPATPSLRTAPEQNP